MNGEGATVIDLSGRGVLVTGAGRGIGRATAIEVAGAGAAVAALDRDEVSCRETADEIGRAGGLAVAVVADVTDESAVATALDRAEAELGPIGGLVNNAGSLAMGPALATTLERWEAQMAVNVSGVFVCSTVAARRMIDRGGGGSIVNVASNAGKVGYPNMAAYNAAKAAVISLTRSLAGEWAEHGINVNAVCPGGVETPMLSGVADWLAERTGESREAMLEAMVPARLGRLIRPHEVGRVIAFLLSDAAVIIRGQSINVDGGDTPY